MAFATVFDVQERYEESIPAHLEAVLPTKLADAEAKVRRRLGDIQAAIEAERCTAEDVTIVLCNMVIRWMQNPKGVRQQNVGPFGYTQDRSNASGKLYLDADDLRQLGLSKGAVSLQMSDDALCRPTRRPGPRPWWVGNKPRPGCEPDCDC